MTATARQSVTLSSNPWGEFEMVGRWFICWILFAPLLLFAQSGLAYSVWHPTKAWNVGSIHYRINLDSFAGLVTDTPVSADQWIWWINYAASNWRDRTGATLPLVYDGGTGAGWLDDGTSAVMATGSCSSSALGCDILAETDLVWPWYSNDLVEMDMRFYQSPGTTWSVRTLGSSSSTDFPAAAVHEFGHVHNLNHTPGGGVMNISQAATTARIPLDDEYNGALALYPNSEYPTVYWRKLGAMGWGAETTSPGAGWTRMNPTAAVGAGAGVGESWVVTGNWGTNKQVYFSRATLPLSSSTNWTTRTAGSSRLSLRPPAIAARKAGSPFWMAAWPMKWNLRTDPCPGASVLISGDGFLSGSFVDRPQVCTVHQVGLTFDPGSGRFVMIWVNRDLENSYNNDLVMASTSLDGVSWTSPKSLGFRAIDTPSIACSAAGQCLLAYGKSDQNDPVIVTQSAVVDSLGELNLQAFTTCPDKVQRPVAVGASSLAGVPRFIFAEHWTNTQSNWSKGVGHLWTSESSAVPYTSFAWRDVGVDSPHASAIATGSSIYDDTYIFYVK